MIQVFIPNCSGNATADTAALTALKTAIGSNQATVQFPASLDATKLCKLNSISFPSNITVDFSNGGIQVVNGQTVTIAGPIIAPNKQIFYNALAGQGTISFLGNTSLSEVWPLWWGGAGDATTAGVGTDNLAAFNAAMAAVSSLDSNGYRAVTMRYPYGRFYFSNTVTPTSQVVIEGVNAGGDIGVAITSTQGGGTVFYVADGVNGIKASSSVGSSHAGFTVLRNLTLMSKGITGATAHGIFIETPTTIEGVSVGHFKGDGIHISANCSTTNANGWIIRDSKSVRNGNNGLLVDGQCGNAGVADHLYASFNGAAGIEDASYLGNLYISCETDSNGTRGVLMSSSDVHSACVFVNHYGESNALMSKIIAPGIVVGGNFVDGLSSDSTATGWTIDHSTGNVKLLLNAAGNSKQNMGMTLRQGADSSEILAFKRASFAHGMTDFADTDVYAAFFPGDGANGGLGTAAFTTGNRAHLFQGYVTTEVLTQGSGDNGAIQIDVEKKSGTSAGPLSAAANAWSLSNSGATVFWIRADGLLKNAGLFVQPEGAVLSVSSNTIAPTLPIHHINDAGGLIKNITVPAGFTSGTIYLIAGTTPPTVDVTGNCGRAVTTWAAGQMIAWTYSSSTSKWYPSL